jgi:hypothetical protein
MTTNPQGRQQARQPLLVLVFVFAVLALPAFFLSPPELLLDLPEFYTAPRLVFEHKGDRIYDIQSFREAEAALFPGRQEEVLYIAPCGLPWLSPLALIPLANIKLIWWLALISSSAAAVVLLCSGFGLPQRATIWMAAFVAALGPQWETIKHGQLSAFLTLALAVFIVAMKNKRPVLAGAALSLFTLKPPLLLPLLSFLAGAGIYSPFLCALPFALALTAISLPMVGIAGYQQYRNLLSYSLTHRNWMAPEAGPTIRGQLLRLFPQADIAVAITATVILLFGLVLLFWLGRRLRRSNLKLQLAFILMPLGMLIQPHCHGYDLLILLPSLAAVISVILAEGEWTWRWSLPLAIFFVMPFYNLLQYNYLLAGGIINPFVIALVAMAAESVLFCLRKKQTADTGAEPGHLSTETPDIG